MGYPLRQLAGLEDGSPCYSTRKGRYPPPTPIDGDSKTHLKAHNLTILALAISSVLTAFLLFLTYYLLLRRLRSQFRRRSPSHTATAAAPLNPREEEEEEVGTHGPSHEGGSNNGTSFHHVWYIRTVGLDDVTISSIATSAYKSDSGLVDGTGCSVCLSEFEEGELVKPLPMCRHAFHVSCIDTWLHAHVNCPLCRTPVVSLPTPPQHQVEEIEEAATGSFFVGGDNPLPSPGIASNRIGPFSNLAPSSSSSSSSSLSSSSSSGGGGGSSSESGTVVQADPVGSEENWVTIDLNEDDASGQHQHMWRSVSMDAVAMGELVSLDGEGTTAEKGAVASEKGGKDGGVDRCRSTNGRRFFFPRFPRSRKTSSILPL